MFEKEFLSRLIATALSRGGEYCDIFIEDRKDLGIRYDQNKVQSVSNGITAGAGIRVIDGTNFVYLYLSDPSEKKLLDLAAETAEAVGHAGTGVHPSLQEVKGRGIIRPAIIPSSIDIDQKIEMLLRANSAAREYAPEIEEVSVNYNDIDQSVTIANSDGVFVNDRRIRTRCAVSSIAVKGSTRETGFYAPGRAKGFEYFDGISPESIGKEASRVAMVRLGSDFAPQGKMPVVIDNEFGGVIFHEACGHALEATAVADGASVFSGRHGKQIANPVVNAVDDGTLPSAWGSADFDDEGNPTQKNQLIKDGILTSYMIDRLGSIKMKVPGTHSSRRENYSYAPTSRMTNTFIEAGNDSFDDMIASIDKGVYCKKMGGGSVNPATTDFNFVVQESYLIEKGKITRPVKGASLIGKGDEILMNIEMVGTDLDFNGTGMCGSLSGSIPANVGQPPIKVSGLVVGGRK